MTLKEILSKLEFSNEIRHQLEEKADSNALKWQEIAKNAYQGENFNFFLCHVWNNTVIIIDSKTSQN